MVSLLLSCLAFGNSMAKVARFGALLLSKITSFSGVSQLVAFFEHDRKTTCEILLTIGLLLGSIMNVNTHSDMNWSLSNVLRQVGDKKGIKRGDVVLSSLLKYLSLVILSLS
jgi:hypothetical protein